MEFGVLCEKAFVLDVETWCFVVFSWKDDDGVELFALQQALDFVIVLAVQVESLEAFGAFAFLLLFLHNLCLLLTRLRIFLTFLSLLYIFLISIHFLLKNQGFR